MPSRPNAGGATEWRVSIGIATRARRALAAGT